MKIDELTEMKRRIESAANERERLRGEMRSLQRMLKDMGFDSIKAVEKRIDELAGKLAKMDSRINELKTELEQIVNKHAGGDDGNS